VRGRSMLSFRIGYAGHTREFHLSRTGLAVSAGLLALAFVLTTQFIYEYRENWAKVRELPNLRRRVSEQNLVLYKLHAKFETLETEVERLRVLDARVRALVNPTEPAPARPGKEGMPTGVGGVETPAGAMDESVDRLLERLGRLSQDVLVDVKDFEILYHTLDYRRMLAESVPVLWPVRGFLSSAFGIRISPFTDTEVFHRGLDIAAPPGTSVMAAASGRVARSGVDAQLGNFVVLEHGNGYRTLYGHLAERTVGEGAVVRQGDPVGTVGDTGRTTGPHLHYEVHVNGLPVNPVRFLDNN
jgi:murein DD-endopeptidase MepM/ murein hydrolase activator NlpD